MTVAQAREKWVKALLETKRRALLLQWIASRSTAQQGMLKYLQASLCSLLMLLVAGLVSAQERHPGVIGDDNRKIVDNRHAPWRAIGQVNVSAYRFRSRCTGSLVASDLVLTAAHCLVDPWTKKPFPLHQIHFLAGVQGSEWTGHSKAKCLHFPADYEYVGPTKILPSMPFRNVPYRSFLKDVAVIVLQEELAVGPLQVARQVDPGPGLPLVHASFPADRRYMLSADSDCRLLKEEQRLWLTDCDTHAASSGGPVFMSKSGGIELAAVMVGAAAHAFTIAVPVSEWITLIQNKVCP